MVTIRIIQTKSITTQEMKQFTLTEKPTGSKDRYENTAYERTYENKEVPVTREIDVTLLNQQVEDEAFDLRRVIAAINDLAVQA